MAEVINMPRLSDTMEEGTVATWLKKVGDTVKEGDILAEIETDKATMEFESFYEGILLHIGIKEGETATVDSLLAIIGEKDEDISDLINGSSTEKSSSDDKNDKDEIKDSEKEKNASEEKDDSNNSKEDSTTELPKGVEVITMPRLSDTMTDGTVASWLKKEGDKVEEGDILAEIETDKATMEFESFYSGTLLKIGIDEGETAPVDSVLAIIGPEGTDVSGVLENFKKGTSSEKKEKPSEDTAKEDKKETSDSTKQETQPAERTDSPRKTVTPTSGERRIFASPLAKKIAAEKGIDLRLVQGSAENGRIVKADIENY